MLFPVALRKLVLDEFVRRRGIGNPQQRLGDTHQQHTFLRGKIVLRQKRLHARVFALAAAHRFDQPSRDCIDFAIFFRR